MKKYILFPIVFLSIVSCSNQDLVLNLKDNYQAKDYYYSLSNELRVSSRPGVYDETLGIDFDYDSSKYDLYYTSNINYLDDENQYFKYNKEIIKIYENEVTDLVNYPCTTSVDGILSWNTNGRCISSTYNNNIQIPGNYRLFPKSSNLNVVLYKKGTKDKVLSKSLSYLVEKDGTTKYTIPIVFVNLPYENIFNSATGFYNNIDQEIASRCNLEMWDPYYDEYFNINSQIKIGGNWSTGYPQRTFNLNFNKDENGKKNTPITNHVFIDRNGVGTDSTLTNFTRLRLHNGGNCFEELTGFNDAFIQRLMTGTNIATSAYRPAIVYLNGEYWGIQALREHYKTSYFAQNYGVNKDDIIMFQYKGSFIFDDGEDEEAATEEFNDFQEYVDAADFNNSDTYSEFITTRIDINSFIDLMVSEAYASNWDFVGNNNNLIMWKSMGEKDGNKYNDGKWRFCMHDVDFAFREYINPLIRNYGNSYFKFNLFYKLWKNTSFRQAFYNRANELVETNLSYDNMNENMTAMVSEIAAFKVQSSYRWGQNSNYLSTWHAYINQTLINAKKRSQNFVSEVYDAIKITS